MTEQKESADIKQEVENTDVKNMDKIEESGNDMVEPVASVSENLTADTSSAEESADDACRSTTTDVPEIVEEADVEESSQVENEEKITLSIEETVERMEVIAEEPVEKVKDEIEKLKQHYYKLRKQEIEEAGAKHEEENKEDKDLSKFVAEPDLLEERLKNALQKYKEKKAQFLAKQEADRADNLLRKQGILDELATLINDADNINKRYSEFQQLQQAFKEITDIPATAVTSMWKNYQHYVEQFYDMLKINKELRDYDFKKNLEQKSAICKSAEDLAESKDIVAAFKELQHLHEEWREIGPVERELREDIWMRFKNASAQINKSYQSHFEKIKEKERVNEEAKTIICDKLEAIETGTLKSFAEWEEKTRQIQDLQTQWRAIGFASRKKNSQLFDKFRKLCDDFFKQKSDYYKGVKDEFSKNLELKRSLCERAEALKESTEWQKSTEKFVAMQKEWKSVGSVPKKYSEAIWKRFVSACDYFFEQKAKEMSGKIEEEKSNLSAKQAILEKIQNFDEMLPKDEAEKELRAAISEWNAIGFVPYREKDKINNAFREAVDKQFERLNIKYRNEKINAYASTIKNMSDGKGSALYSERERLVRTYERIKSEMQTYQNNIGFLNISSKQGNAFVKEMERKINKLGDDMQMIAQKIALIDESIKNKK